MMEKNVHLNTISVKYSSMKIENRLLKFNRKQQIKTTQFREKTETPNS